MKNLFVGDNTLSRYEKIAVDIAYSIAQGEWSEGSMIQGRSSFSGKYSSSPETIRRAVKLLEEYGVVEVMERRGILIRSKEKAKSYIDTFRQQDKILTQREEIAKLGRQMHGINQEINERIDWIIEQAMVLRNVGLITPLEAKVGKNSHLIGKTIGEVRFWARTGATIIGINRNGHLMLSPGPKLIFYADDIILYVGNSDDNIDRVEKFINS